MKTKQKLLNKDFFNYVNPNIETLFKPEPIRGLIEIRNFGKYMTSEEIIAELAKDGCYPANATELFDWAEKRPEEKDKYVVALGSVASFEGGSQVCHVWYGGSGRDAGLGWFGRDWRDRCWFAFGRESTQSSDTETSALVPLELGRGWKYQLGDNVRKINGARWQGKVVGFYSSSLTERGYAVESTAEIGSVQIYPESALEKI